MGTDWISKSTGVFAARLAVLEVCAEAACWPPGNALLLLSVCSEPNCIPKFYQLFPLIPLSGNNSFLFPLREHLVQRLCVGYAFREF